MSWKVADLEPPLAGVFKNAEVATSLGTAVSTRVHVQKPAVYDAELETWVTVIIDRAVNLGNQSTSPGSWSVLWQAGDLDTTGIYWVELEIEWTSGRKQTTPSVAFYVGDQIA